MKLIIFLNFIFSSVFSYAGSKQIAVPNCLNPENQSTIPGHFLVGYKSDDFGMALVESLNGHPYLYVTSHMKFIAQLYIVTDMSKIRNAGDENRVLGYFQKLLKNPDVIFVVCSGGGIGVAQ